MEKEIEKMIERMRIALRDIEEEEIDRAREYQDDKEELERPRTLLYAARLAKVSQLDMDVDGVLKRLEAIDLKSLRLGNMAFLAVDEVVKTLLSFGHTKQARKIAHQIADSGTSYHIWLTIAQETCISHDVERVKAYATGDNMLGLTQLLILLGGETKEAEACIQEAIQYKLEQPSERFSTIEFDSLYSCLEIYNQLHD